VRAACRDPACSCGALHSSGPAMAGAAVTDVDLFATVPARAIHAACTMVRVPRQPLDRTRWAAQDPDRREVAARAG
jgi:hypothetical protein